MLAETVEQRDELVSQLGDRADLGAERAYLLGQQGPGIDFRGQTVPDLGERKPESPQRDDLVQATGVGFAVEAVPAGVALRRTEQADLVVMVQGADGQASGIRQLSDPPRLGFQAHISSFEPDVTSGSRASHKETPTDVVIGRSWLAVQVRVSQRG